MPGDPRESNLDPLPQMTLRGERMVNAVRLIRSAKRQFKEGKPINEVIDQLRQVRLLAAEFAGI